MKDAVSFTAGLYLLLGKLSMLWSRYVCGSVCLCSFFCVPESELSKCHYRTAICACCFPLWLPVFNPQFDKQLKSFTQHDDWTTAKIALCHSHVFLLCICIINLSLFLILLFFSHHTSWVRSILYWQESQMNSINQGSKYKRKLTREIINKQIKHKPCDFPTVSFICLPISIIFYLLLNVLSPFFF